MKKLVRIDEHNWGEYTVEELLEKYDLYLEKVSWSFHRYVERTFPARASMLEKDDFKQIAMMCLMKAFANYDKDKNVAFFSLFDKYVQNMCLRTIYETLRLRRQCNEGNTVVKSMDEPCYYSDTIGDVYYADMVIDERVDVEAKVIQNITIETCLSVLTEVEKNVIVGTYYDSKTQKEIAAEVGISQAHICRVLKRALKKMRRAAEQGKPVPVKGEKENMSRKPNMYKKALLHLRHHAKEGENLQLLLEAFAKEHSLEVDALYEKLMDDYGPEMIRLISVCSSSGKQTEESLEIDVHEQEEQIDVVSASALDLPALSDVKIVRFDVELKMCTASLQEDVTRLSIANNSLNEDGLIQLKHDIDRILEIRKNIYK